MSDRRSISFDSDESEILKEFDNNGKSRFAKEAMRFFIKFRDKVFIVPDGMSNRHIVDIEKKKNIKSLIK